MGHELHIALQRFTSPSDDPACIEIRDGFHDVRVLGQTDFHGAHSE